MNPLQLEPTTGFLQPKFNKINSFDADKKTQIIQAIATSAESGQWPGIHRICKALSVAPSTFYEHLELDEEFKAQYDNALLALEDHLVDNLVRQGQGANGVTANIFLLKNRWAKRWNENYQVNFRGDNGQLKGVIEGKKDFIDAEIVPSAVPTVDKATGSSVESSGTTDGRENER